MGHRCVCLGDPFPPGGSGKDTLRQRRRFEVKSSRPWHSGALLMAPAVVCGTPQSAVNNSWLWLQISSRALLAGSEPVLAPAELAGRQVMAEERFLLAQPLLPFLPQQQQRRKRSLESVVVPGSRTLLLPGSWNPLSQPLGSLLGVAHLCWASGTAMQPPGLCSPW